MTMYGDTEALQTTDLVGIFEANYRGRIAYDELAAVAAVITTGSKYDRIGLLHRWLTPVGSRPLAESAIEAALRSWDGPSDYAPGSRVLVGDAMPANATADRPDRRYEIHRGLVDIAEDGRDVPVWWSHQADQNLGRLVGYQRDLNGPGSLRVWVELAGGAQADAVLTRADYGRIGLSVGVFHDPKVYDGGSVIVIGGQSLREVSLVPLERAAFGATTVVRRVALPAHIAETYAAERAAVAARSAATGATWMHYRSYPGARITKVDGVPVAGLR